jgi:hypothetical protein
MQYKSNVKNCFHIIIFAFVMGVRFKVGESN